MWYVRPLTTRGSGTAVSNTQQTDPNGLTYLSPPHPTLSIVLVFHQFWRFFIDFIHRHRGLLCHLLTLDWPGYWRLPATMLLQILTELTDIRKFNTKHQWKSV